MHKKITNELLTFIENCPSSFHTVDTVKNILKEEGYTHLQEGEAWKLTAGEKYFVTRNLSSLIAFRIPEEIKGFMITASHGESPCFKIKAEPEMIAEGVVKLNVEKYGGMILSSWLDRPLSVAGRITVATENGIDTRLVNIDRDLLNIPSLAIHMNREVNDGVALNPQKDMLPIFADESEKGTFMHLIAENAGVKTEDILGTDLFVYCRSASSVWGKNGEFFSSPRIDDLQCAFGTLKGFLDSNCSKSTPVYCVFDNEEVGSGTKQGAKSTFLYDTLRRISEIFGINHEGYVNLLSNSFMVSADNGHAVHPNNSEKADPTCRPKMNGGVLIKYNANQKYTTDAVSEGIFLKICKNAGVPTQKYVNRSDVLGGSTLGNLSAEKVSVNTIDIGLAQLSMHSAYETAGCLDTMHLISSVKEFYNTSLTATADGKYTIE